MTVAIAGLGRMGSAFAERLLGAGHDLAVYNRSPQPARELVERGATAVDTPAQLWGRADVVISMVADSQALEDVALTEGGLVRGAPPAAGTLIEMSTVSVDASRKVAEVASTNGLDYLRAPVSGNPAVVAAGNLGILVSGSREAYERVEDVLRTIGPKLFYLGEGEQARVMKLALNLMVAGTAELIAEALVLGEVNGLERAKILEVIEGSAIGSPFVKYKAPPLLDDDYSTTFSTRLMGKDLDLALGSAGESEVPLPVTALVRQLLEACVAAGMADVDFMALLPRLQREAGLEVEMPLDD